MKRTVFVAAIAFAFSVSQYAYADIVPVYQQADTDATWTHQGGGVYTVPSSAEDYANEIWERPVQDPDWSDDGTTRTSLKIYYAYGDLKAGAWGIGTSGTVNDDTSTDYLFVQWEVVGAFQHEVDKDAESKLLEAHYYFYAEPAGKDAIAIEVPSGKDLGADFGDVAGKVNIYEEENGGAPVTAITVTEEGGDGFHNAQPKGEGRTNTSTFVTEVAVKLSGYGLTLADFDTDVDYAYIGVAVSNPSGADTDLFANDHFPDAKGSGQEYDTMRMGTLVPEPATMSLLALGGLAILRRRRR